MCQGAGQEWPLDGLVEHVMDARAQINGALVDEYRDLLRGYFVGPFKGTRDAA